MRVYIRSYLVKHITLCYIQLIHTVMYIHESMILYYCVYLTAYQYRFFRIFSWLSCIQPNRLIRYSPTTTSHTRYTSRMVHVCFNVDREIITCVPTNSHACKTCDSYTSRSHACAIYFLVLSVCESRLVTQFYKSNACYKCFTSQLAKSIVIEEFVSAAGYSPNI